MRVFDARETRERLPMAALVDALRTMFTVGCELPPRQVLELAAPGDDAVTSLVMAAWQRGGCLGVKVVNIAPGNAVRALPALHATYTLFDATTGVPLASLDGDEITARRTAATSALAASWLARPEARHLAIVGAGRIARLLADAHRVCRPIERVTVWARSHERARALARDLAGCGYDARAVESIESAVAEADIVSCATLSCEPLVRGAWLPPGSHLDLIGSFTPEMREADDDCFRSAAVAVDNTEALTKSGDLIGPIARGIIAASAVVTLGELARGEREERASDVQRTVFKSVGSALEDLAAAMLVQRNLREAAD